MSIESPATFPLPLPLESGHSRMARLDFSKSERMPILMELVGQLSRATEPTEMQTILATSLRRLNPVDGFISVSRRGLAPGEYKFTRLALTSEEISSKLGNPWRDWDSIPTHSGGLIGEIIRSAYPEVIHHLDAAADPVLGDRLATFGSLMAIPLFDNGEPINWAISLRRNPEGFSVADVEDQILRSNLVGNTVRTVVLAKQLREANERNREEVERIVRIQKALLPDSMPAIPGVSLAASYETFDRAGGDLYTFRAILAERERDVAPAHSPWAILIADASGHGPSAAVVSAMLHAIVHAFPRPPASAAELLTHANDHLAAKRIESSFVTAFAMIYDPTTRRLVYSRAGHEPPILKNPGSGGATRRIDDAGGLPLGVLEGYQYEDAEMVLERGQTMVLYTDGITEARNPAGDMFSTEGIERALLACTGDPDCVIGSITGALKEHEAGLRPGDDQTLLAMKVL